MVFKVSHEIQIINFLTPSKDLDSAGDGLYRETRGLKCKVSGQAKRIFIGMD